MPDVNGDWGEPRVQSNDMVSMSWQKFAEWGQKMS